MATKIFAAVAMMFVLATAVGANHLPQSTPESLEYIGELPLADVFPCTNREGVSGVCFVHQGLDEQYLVVLTDPEILYEIWAKSVDGLKKLYPFDAAF